MASTAPLLIGLLAAQFYTPGPLSQTQLEGKDRSGAELFATVCSQCHVDNSPSATRAPSATELRDYNRQQIKDALIYGPMDTVGHYMTDKEIDNIADFIATPAPKPAGDAKPAAKD